MTADELPPPVAWVRYGCLVSHDGHDVEDMTRRGWEPLYTRTALDAVMAQERERCAAIVQANADACLTDLLRNVLASNAAAIRAHEHG
jgi:hypothetical protein